MFVTLTAPSFGLVHTRPLGPDGQPRRCRPRRDAPVCPHGVRLSCGAVHDEDDPCLGEPLCRECFDYAGAVRLEQRARRAVAPHDDLPAARARAPDRDDAEARCASSCASSYVKVAEYQRRGLVHLHVVIRLDRAMPDYRARRAQAARRRGSTSSCSRTRSARPSPTVTRAGPGRARRRPRRAGASELDVRQLDARRARRGRRLPGQVRDQEHRAGRRRRCTASPSTSVDELPVREHVRAYMRAAFALDADPALADRRFARVRARARLPRALPDQEPPLLDHVQGAARRPRGLVHEQLLARSRDAAQRAIAAAAPERVREPPTSSGRATSQPSTRYLAEQRPRERARSTRASPAKSCATNHQPEGGTDARPRSDRRCADGRVRAVPDRARGGRAAADRTVHGAAVLRRGRAAGPAAAIVVRGGRCAFGGARSRRRCSRRSQP